MDVVILVLKFICIIDNFALKKPKTTEPAAVTFPTSFHNKIRILIAISAFITRWLHPPHISILKLDSEAQLSCFKFKTPLV